MLHAMVDSTPEKQGEMPGTLLASIRKYSSQLKLSPQRKVPNENVRQDREKLC